MFIATANVMDPIPSALKDRLEVIRLTGYTAEEKLAIAERYLIPRQLEANGLAPGALRFTRPALLKIITGYTAEAGLRNLEREMGSGCRKVARRVAEGKSRPVAGSESAVARFLGPPRYLPEEERHVSEVGVATGLAWTEVGGDTLQIEAVMLPGKGRMQTTGKLGEVMKESIDAARSFVRSKATSFGIKPPMFDKRDIHVHVPEGATPKDGPSAGLTILIALVSLLTGRPARREVAMTGEITLTGRILPVGAIREKVLAARRAKVKTVVVPARNREDVEELSDEIKKDVELRLADSIAEVVDTVLV